ncbi:methyltransferase domain-containing protein [Nocardia panacis]|uniref:site-specific DNA-methyltransferase (adenine-specific) n=1 Tax=Nocardia panacis TaxID=2340916 RepID=A0A3A4JZT0_9NOCA|nr:N-6 DNA methylase [Nocardia panacis]RJO69021.1 methyltransferase domain-containing protein [Nocardia panacis]
MASEAGGPGDRKRHGRHYTPPELARFLARRLLARSMGTRLRVLDPACGDGELLLALCEEAGPGLRLELTGYDLDPAAVALARARAAEAGIEITWHTGDFLSAAGEQADGAFDAVITNPPYVRTQQLGGETAQLLARRFGLRGRIDLTHPFVAMVPRLLRPGGVLGLLCANRFLTTKAGANMRRVLRTDLTPVELYDLGDTKLFSAAVLPAVTIAVRDGRPGPCRYVSAYEVPGGEIVGDADLFEALVGARGGLVGHNGRTFAVEIGRLATGNPLANPPENGSVAARPSDDEAWRLSRPGVDDWLRRIGARTWRTFGEVGRIRVGVKTTADRVFISDRWDEVTPSPEPELLLELITHDDVAPWRVRRAADTRVLYPYDTGQSTRAPIDLAEYPGAAAYLRRHRAQLAGRDYVTDSGRKWFEIWVPQRPNLWAAPKVVFPDISDRPRFALDRSGAVVNGDCYWISLTDLAASGDPELLAHLLMGVANSALGLRFYDAVCGNRLYSGRRRWITQYVSRMPLPDPDSASGREIAKMARDFVDAGVPPDPERVRLLDERVAAAFGVA